MSPPGAPEKGQFSCRLLSVTSLSLPLPLSICQVTLPKEESPVSSQFCGTPWQALTFAHARSLSLTDLLLSVSIAARRGQGWQVGGCGPDHCLWPYSADM